MVRTSFTSASPVGQQWGALAASPGALAVDERMGSRALLCDQVALVAGSSAIVRDYPWRPGGGTGPQLLSQNVTDYGNRSVLHPHGVRILSAHSVRGPRSNFAASVDAPTRFSLRWLRQGATEPRCYAKP